MNRIRSACGLILTGVLCLGAAVSGAELLRSNFDDDKSMAGWTPSEGALIAPFGRAGRSLEIVSEKGQKTKATWTSPAFSVTGTAFQVSGWLAENYTVLGAGGGDELQFASMSVQFLDKDGKPVGPAGFDAEILRTDSRPSDVFGGPWIEPEGLRWCFRKATVTTPPGAVQARLVLCFPRDMTKGHVFLDDVQVIEAAPAATAAPASDAASAVWPDTLLVNTPAPQNVFTVKEPLEFDIAFWGEPGTNKAPRKASIPAGAVIQWNVTDFLEERLADGSVEAGKRQSFTNYNKGECEILVVTLNEAMKKNLGTLLFFEAQLVADGVVLAKDTCTFMVTDPRPASTPRELANSHFEGGCARLGITASTGADWALSSWLDKDTPPESVMEVPHTTNSLIPRYLYLLYAQCSQTAVGNTKEKKVYCGYPQWMLVPWEAGVSDVDKAGMPNQLDWDAFGRFMRALTKAYSEKVHLLAVDPAASERLYTELSHRMQMTGYKAVKAVDTNIPVGLSTYNMYNTDDLVEKYMAKGAFDYCDVIDDHIYAGSHAVRPMAARIDRLYHRLEKMGKPKKFVTTEMAAVGTLEHEAKATDQIQMVVDLMAAHVTYFNCFYSGYGPGRLTKPSLRQWPRTGEQFEQFAFVDPLNGPKIFRGAEKIDWRREMPLLRMTAMYGLQRFLGWADFRDTLAADELTRAYAFEQDGRGVIVGYRMAPGGDRLFLVKAPGARSVTVVDIFGRSFQEAIDGNQGIVLALHEAPAFWVFDAPAKGASLQALDGKFAPSGVLTAGKCRAAFRMTGCTSDWSGATAQIVMGKPYAAPAPVTVKTKATEPVALDWTLEVPDNAPRRVGPALKVVKDGVTLAMVDSVWSQDVPVRIVVDTDPVVPGRQPAVLITVANSGSRVWNGKVEVSNPYFAAADKEPAAYAQEFVVKSGEAKTARFAVESVGPLKINEIYPVTVSVSSPEEPKRAWQQNLSFIACRKRVQPIKVDGSLDDWDVQSLTVLEFPRTTSAAWKGKDDCSCKVYTRWDEEYLYIAYDLTDDVWYNTAQDDQIWPADAIMQSILPGTIEPGKPRSFQPTRAHLGLNAKEQPVMDFADVGSTGLSDKTGVKFSVKRTKAGMILEMAYPFAKLGPLQPGLGSKFRMADWVFDLDAPNTGQRILAMFAFVSHVDRNPDYWADWKMTE